MQNPPDPPEPVSRPRNPIGSMVGRYRVLARLGSGGQGEVYLAEDPRLFRKVALKRLPPELAGDKEARRKAIAEAIRASRLSDPRVAEVFDVVEEENDVTLVLEYVEGQTLRDSITQGIPLETFWDLAVQCVEAVEAAHRGGLLHRDIKPENIVVTPKDQVKILDFGIAKRLPRREELASMTTQTYVADLVAGTPPYMSPEAHLNLPLDERSDLFSLGVVFYEMLTGHRPFQGNLAEVIDGILRCRPPAPSTIDARVPAGLDYVIMKLLSRDRDQRYSTASELLDDLSSARRGELTVQTPAGTVPTQETAPGSGERREPGRRRWLWISGSVVTVLLVTSIAVPDLRFQWKRALGMSVLPDRVSATVLSFGTEGSDADITPFSRGLSRVVATRLNRLGAAAGVYVSPPDEVRRYEVASPEKARTELGVTVALRTTVKLSGTDLEGRTELVDAQEGRVLGRATIREPWTEPARFADGLTARAARLLEIEPVEQGAADSLVFETPASAYRTYLEGVGELDEAADSASVAAAMVDVQRAVMIAPEFAAAWAELAVARFSMFQETGNTSWLDESDAAVQRALDRDPTLPAAHHVRGRILGERKRWPQAVAELRMVLDRDPANGPAYENLANAYLELGLPDSAEAVHEASVAALPLDYHCYWYLGYFHYKRGQDQEALDAFRRMTEAAPDLGRGYAYYGGLLVQSGQYRRGVAALKRSIELRPDNSAFANLGTAYFQLRDFDRAIHTYREAIGFGYTNYRMWYNLAEAYYWAPGKRRLASECYARAVMLAREQLAETPVDIQLLAEMADMLPKTGQPDSARAAIDRCLESKPHHPYVNYWAALVAWQLGDRKEALDRLEEAVAGGYSVAWLRDSPVFDGWRHLERFQAILERDEES